MLAIRLWTVRIRRKCRNPFLSRPTNPTSSPAPPSTRTTAVSATAPRSTANSHCHRNVPAPSETHRRQRCDRRRARRKLLEGSPTEFACPACPDSAPRSPRPRCGKSACSVAEAKQTPQGRHGCPGSCACGCSSGGTSARQKEKIDQFRGCPILIVIVIGREGRQSRSWVL